MYKTYNSATSTWEAQLEDIKNAKHVIYFEQYILKDFENNEIGRQYIDALMERARAGVEVKLILDLQGSLSLFRDTELNKELKESGLLIIYYKTLPASKAFSPVRLMLRNHRKFLLIDHEISWIGGVVVGEEYRDWGDLMVRFDDFEIADYCNREFRRQLQRLRSGKVLLAPLDRIDKDTELVGNSPGIGNRFCYEKISHQIMLAEKSIILVTPYFAPPLRLRRVITRRLLDGLDVQLIISKHTDSKYADWARETFLNKMIKQGLKIKYLDFMNHAKIVLIDDEWATFGSTNLDALSLIFNHELNLITRNNYLVKDINKIILQWCHGVQPVGADELLYKSLSPFKRIVGKLVRNFA